MVKRLFSMNLTHEEDFLVSEERSSRVSAGQFVSLPSVVVESEDMRDKIRHSAPEAIGGDMEGGKLLKFRKLKVW